MVLIKTLQEPAEKSAQNSAEESETAAKAKKTKKGNKSASPANQNKRQQVGKVTEQEDEEESDQEKNSATSASVCKTWLLSYGSQYLALIEALQEPAAKKSTKQPKAAKSPAGTKRKQVGKVDEDSKDSSAAKKGKRKRQDGDQNPRTKKKVCCGKFCFI